jgi:hypothetical protein
MDTRTWLKTENGRLDSQETESRPLGPRGRTALAKKDWKWKMMRTKLQRTETTMVLMMREVLSVKVSVTNTHTDVTGRPVISRAWYTRQTLSWLFAIQISPKVCWNHLQKHHKTEFLTFKMAEVHILEGLYVYVPV